MSEPQDIEVLAGDEPQEKLDAGLKQLAAKAYTTQKNNPFKKHTLEQAKETITKWLVISDKEVIDVVFAFAIAERLPGDPLWLFLIAPPGGGKTELLRAMEGEKYYHLSDLTSKTFVSGLMLGQGETRHKIEDLLPQLNRKVLIFKDFTTVLEKNKDERREIIAQLREIYDGSFAKKFGTINHKVEYKARFGFIAGVTPIIDKHWKIMQQLGERFLKWRMLDDAQAQTKKAEQNEGNELDMRREIKEAVMGFLTYLAPLPPDISQEQSQQLIDAAHFLAICRTPVTIQSAQTDFYFDYIPTPEIPTRVVKQLKKFCKALAIVRGKKEVTQEEVNTALKIVEHTCPPDRLAVLKAINSLYPGYGDGVSVSMVKHAVKLPETSLRRVCEQLELLDLIKKTTVTTESYGGKTTVDLYKTTPAPYPPPFLECSKKVVVEGASPRKHEEKITTLPNGVIAPPEEVLK